MKNTQANIVLACKKRPIFLIKKSIKTTIEAKNAYRNSQSSSCSTFSTCENVSGQPEPANLQGNITVLAIFSNTKFRTLAIMTLNKTHRR